MNMGFRIVRFPASAAEAAELALSACPAEGSQLVVFAEDPAGQIIVHGVHEHTACPCHADVTPLNIQRLERIMLVRLISHEDEGTAVCGWHIGLHAAALSAGNLSDSLVVDGTRWSSWKGERASPWRTVPQTDLSVSALRWRAPTQRCPSGDNRPVRQHRVQQPRRKR